MISFIVPGEPKGKGRPRIGKGFAYTPKDTVNYENWVKTCFINRVLDSENVFQGEIRATILCYYAIPNSTSKKKRELIFQDKIRPTKKPDLDNIAKIILDSLNGIAYKDDSQVVMLTVAKYYSENPRVEVILEGLNG